MPLVWAGPDAICNLRSAIWCLRGSHSSAGIFARENHVDLIQAETTWAFSHKLCIYIHSVKNILALFKLLKISTIKKYIHYMNK